MSGNVIEELASDFIGILGRPVATVPEAAQLLACSVGTIRGCIYRGDLTGSRMAANAHLKIRVRELARFLVEGEKRSLPDQKINSLMPKSKGRTRKEK